VRATAEWIAKHDDEAIPPRVRLRVWDRFGGCCAECKRKIHAGEKWDADHITALVNGGRHRESNLQLLCAWCHKAKTKADVAEKAVTYRKRRVNHGIKKPRAITRWRKFDGTPVHASRQR
jgi:5-methylcytosine-specific restriction endonuclease McrA